MSQFKHYPGCARDRELYLFVGNLGDVMAKCLTCRAYGVHAKEEPATQTDRCSELNRWPTPTAAPTRLATRAVSTGYACRPHHAPVNARGQGCAWCRSEAEQDAERRTERRSKRAAKRRASK